MKIIVELNDLTVKEYDEAVLRHDRSPNGLEAAIRFAVLKELRTEVASHPEFIKVYRSVQGGS